MKNLVRLDFARDRASIICHDVETGDQTEVEIDLDCVKIADAATNGYWFVQKTNPKGRTRYCMSSGGGRTLYLHRVLCLGMEPNLETAHLDGDGLNCRRENLKALTVSAHRKLDALRHSDAKCTSLVGARGVQKIGSRYRAFCERKHLGMFATLKQAKLVANQYRAQAFDATMAAL